ncbi:MAG: hypothetical protein QNJ54_14110 [Prochloraceae cyanobacterium]|nr:hypothetical protein [Prochloraceae cyanobacterium]
MAIIFQGCVELSENSTNQQATWIGTLLKFPFQVKKMPKIIENPQSPNTYIFPTIKIKTQQVETWLEWQQHEVRINDFLIGTIRNLPQIFSKNNLNNFVFQFQPKILKIDSSDNLEDISQYKVNYLTIELGTGGFGLNDSFIVQQIEIENVETNFT